ncbi:amidohydrolase [Nocardia terpenica]|uniref:Amidohydrolase n=1 Tax=Nocardia terpenica TaxID=455432 RepID=A0A291RGH1_9NOCA|nr:amidohydrolase [Nocardia terpenica]ATL66683.1 amidohydrolase [Nocardia terpenica]
MIERQPLLVTAARITTLDGPDAEAMALIGDRILAVGSLADLRDRFAAARIVDLGGHYIVPGFNDAHCHPSVTAETRLRLDVSPATTADVDALTTRIAQRAATVADGEWIFAAGYHPQRMPGADPRLTRDLLDRISMTKPIAVVLFNWHTAVVNSAALRLLGIDDGTADPVGGEFGRDHAGRLDGWLFEQAFLNPYFSGSGRTPWIPELDDEQLTGALLAENEYLHSVGITSYTDAIVTPQVWRIYEIARSAGTLTPRVGMLLWNTYFDSAEQLGLRSGFGDERLRFVGVKAMYDGGLFGGTCLCRHPYAAGTGADNGIRLVDRAEFADLVRRVHDSGSRICVHANGDRAVSEVLDAIEAARAANPGNRINHRIEHCSMVDAELLHRIRAADATPVPFSGGIRQHAPQLVRYYGADRATGILPHRAFLDTGITVAGSSDYPTTPAEPLAAIESLLTRASAADGTVLGPEHRISVREALELYTIGSAAATGESHLKGTLTPGMLADFTVLDTDIVAHPDRIGAASVAQTWVGGTPVWSRE